MFLGVTISRQKSIGSNRNESPSKTEFIKGNNNSSNNSNFGLTRGNSSKKSVNFSDIRRSDSTGNNNMGGESSSKDQPLTKQSSSGNSYRSNQRNNQRDTRDIDNNKWR
ncbi:hypothetical protein RS030_91522 [Cryptosporidium xiaoi]|uniref:Uncharacterized protein n=1 Tax=Cryptosporidium xiaoi TaxID=659607 RepID=A0AAV9XVJ7_9CRYT